MVTSGRGPARATSSASRRRRARIKAELPTLELCVSLGLMDEPQARELKSAGIGWVNHNLNTSERFHPEICTTHTYADRVRTVENVRRAGLSTCCGGIIGMGETDADVVDLAFALRELGVDSLPVNFLIPIDGTPLARTPRAHARRCLKTLCLFRFTNPARRDPRRRRPRAQSRLVPAARAVRRQLDLRRRLPDDTRPGEREAHRMVEEMGFEVERAGC